MQGEPANDGPEDTARRLNSGQHSPDELASGKWKNWPADCVTKCAMPEVQGHEAAVSYELS